MAVNLDAIRRKMAQLNSKGGGGSRLWRPNEVGEYRIRALPWPEGKTVEGVPFIERYFYWIGSNSVLCPKQFGEEDQINDLITQLFRTKDPTDRETAKSLMPKLKVYLPIIVKGQEDKGVQVWAFTREIYQRLLTFFGNEEIGDFTDINEGFDLIVNVTDTGKKFGPKNNPVFNQTVDAARKSTPLSKWYGDNDAKVTEVLKSIPDIDAMNADYRKTPAQVNAMLQNWLDSGDKDKEKAEGTARGPAVEDKLDALANEVNAKTAPVTEASKPVEDKKKGKKSKTAEEELDTAAVAKVDKDLDSALDELMV